MKSVALYEIADMRDVLDTWLAEADGELTPEIEQLMADLESKFEDKVERVALFIREQKSLAEAVKTERDRLGAIATRRLKAAESLTGYLHREMDRMGRDKVNGVLVTVALQKNPPAVKGELSPEALEILYRNGPAVVRRVPESFTLDRKAVLDAYKAGQAIPAGLTVEQSSSIRIR